MLHTLRTTLPGVAVGLLVGLSFLETPLKFLAPGVTMPIGLGIGRLVLTAANIAGGVLLVAITIVSIVAPRVPRGALVALGGLWAVLLVEVAVIRPPLQARSDVIIAGGDPGSSPLHVFYIAADLLLIVLLVVYLIVVTRSERRRRSEP